MAKYSIWDYRKRSLQSGSGAYKVEGLDVCTTAFQLGDGTSKPKAEKG